MEIRTINSVAGGYTFNFTTGVYDDVEVFDWSSLYPSVIVTYNISPETIITKEFAEKHNIPYITIPSDFHTADGILYEEKYFRKDIEGILPKLLKEVLRMRYEKKYEKFKYKESNPQLYNKMKAEEVALKIVANSSYGFFGFKSSRMYNPIIANAITQCSRYLTKQMIEISEKNGFKVLAGDTDSIFIINQSEHNIDFLENKFKERVIEIVNETNAMSSEYLVFEHEKTFERLCYIKKKNYATLTIERDKEGKVVGEPQISITGLECKKKDTSPLGKEWQYKLVVDCYLLNKITIDDYIQQLRDFKEEFKKGNVDTKYLVMAKTLTKHPKEYEGFVIDSKTGEPKVKKDGTYQKKSIPAHVKLAERMMEEGYDINVGDLIRYVVKKSKPRIEAITLEEYKETNNLAKEYYWEKCIKPVLKVLFVVDKDVVYDNKELWFIKKPRNYVNSLNTFKKNFK
jgi:DNA polymerase elongation subunit (family B)